MGNKNTTHLQAPESVDILKTIYETGDLSLDRYGFVRGNESDEKENDTEIEKKNIKEQDRELKWFTITMNWDLYFGKPQFKRRLRKGIPESARSVVWKKLLYGTTIQWRNKFPIPQLEHDSRSLPAIVVDEIEKDITRTYPHHILFRQSNSNGQQSLRRILQWYAVVDPETGYCQAMSFIAAMLLIYMNEDDAFYGLVSIMQRHQMPLREMYLPGLVNLQKCNHVFDCCGKLFLPGLWAKFER